jgi:hypothetical protein
MNRRRATSTLSTPKVARYRNYCMSMVGLQVFP